MIADLQARKPFSSRCLTQTLLHVVLAQALALGSTAPARASHGGADCQVGPVCQGGLVRPQDAVWLVSTRHLGCVGCAPVSADFRVWHYQAGCWTEGTIEAFCATDDPETVTAIYVHGNRIKSAEAISGGMSVYAHFCGPGGRGHAATICHLVVAQRSGSRGIVRRQIEGPAHGIRRLLPGVFAAPDGSRPTSQPDRIQFWCEDHYGRCALDGRGPIRGSCLARGAPQAPGASAGRVDRRGRGQHVAPAWFSPRPGAKPGRSHAGRLQFA